MIISPFIIKAVKEFAIHAIKKTAHSQLDKHLEHAPAPRPLTETERQYLANKTQCDLLSVRLQQEQTLLQAERLELEHQYLVRKDEREQLALTIQREQLEWQKQSHQAQIEQSKQQIQAEFDKNRWAGIWSREELLTILQNSAQRHQLLLLLSEPKITDNCPDTFKHDLPTDVPNELKVFMQHHYPFDHNPHPVQFFGRFFEKSVFDTHVKQYENLLHDSVPTIVLYSEMSSSKFYLHSHAWGFGEHALNETCALNWSDSAKQLMADGLDKDEAHTPSVKSSLLYIPPLPAFTLTCITCTLTLCISRVY